MSSMSERRARNESSETIPPAIYHPSGLQAVDPISPRIPAYQPLVFGHVKVSAPHPVRTAVCKSVPERREPMNKSNIQLLSHNAARLLLVYHYSNGTETL